MPDVTRGWLPTICVGIVASDARRAARFAAGVNRLAWSFERHCHPAGAGAMVGVAGTASVTLPVARSR